MGLRSPFDYVGYEVACGETIIYLLDTFCHGCHTNEDYDDGCNGCPAGQLIYKCKDYLKDAYESDFFPKQVAILQKIKKQIKVWNRGCII